MSNEGLYNSITDYAEWLYSYFDKIGRQPIDENQFVFPDVFNVRTLTRPEYVSLQAVGLPMLRRREPLQDLAEVKYGTGEALRRRPKSYGFRTAFPKELIIHIEKAAGHVDQDLAALISSYARFMKDGKFGAMWRAELEAADLFNNFTSTSAIYATRGGVAIAATHTTASNPAYTQTNFAPNLALTETNVFNAIQDLRNQRAENGARMTKPTKFTIVTDLTNERLAWQLLNTDKEIDTANNTANAIAAMKKKGQIDMVVWPELTEGSWGVIADNAELTFLWYDKPSYSREEHGRNRSVEYQCNAMWVQPFAEEWQGIWWSPVQ